MTTRARSDHDLHTLADAVGLQRWQVEYAESAGLLPQPGPDPGWTSTQIEQIRHSLADIIARVGTEHAPRPR
ncbi:hypothetical protein ACWIGI_41590 [Nocardia sp. NPDC055321]